MSTAVAIKNLFINRLAGTVIGTLLSLDSKYNQSGEQIKIARVTSLGQVFSFVVRGKQAESFNPAQGASIHIEAEGFMSQEGLDNPTDVLALNKVRVVSVMPKTANRPEHQSFTTVAQIGKFDGAIRTDDRMVSGEMKHVTNLKLGLSGKDAQGTKGYVNFETAIWDRAGLDQYLTPGALVMLKNGKLSAKVNEDKNGGKHVNVTLSGNPDLVPTGQNAPTETAANGVASGNQASGGSWDDTEIPF